MHGAFTFPQFSRRSDAMTAECCRFFTVNLIIICEAAPWDDADRVEAAPVLVTPVDQPLAVARPGRERAIA